jgi:hypothetical protein
MFGPYLQKSNFMQELKGSKQILNNQPRQIESVYPLTDYKNQQYIVLFDLCELFILTTLWRAANLNINTRKLRD